MLMAGDEEATRTRSRLVSADAAAAAACDSQLASAQTEVHISPSFSGLLLLLKELMLYEL